jgi:hypothetical protein
MIILQGRNGIHPARSYWLLKGIHAAKSILLALEWIHPARSYCLWLKGIHAAKSILFLALDGHTLHDYTVSTPCMFI